MKTEKKTMKTEKAVALYNLLKGLKVGKLKGEMQYAVLRNARALKSVATSFEDFLSDARERLKPGEFEEVIEKFNRFDTLEEGEKQEVNRIIMDYQKRVDECVHEELEREQEIDPLTALDDEALTALSAGNELTVEQLLTLSEM
ncbi:MAG: hypothetical protein HDS62_07620 [Bacteroidales bacterium]|nr:hypothetical protein [Bacteroidales bacterium]